MIISDFIQSLKSRGITLWRDGDGLGFSAPGGALDPETKTAILAARPELLAWLGEDRDAPVICPDHAGRTEPFPLTDIQRAYLIGRDPAFELGGNAAHAYTEIEVRGLDADRFETAWRATIAAHDSLRTRFLPDGTQSVMADVCPPAIERLDLRHLSQLERERRLQDIRAQRSYRDGDIHSWPQFDVLLVRLDENVSRLSFSFDLMVADAFSGELMLRELFHRYDGKPVIPPHLSFRDVARAATVLETVRRENDLAYWQDRAPSVPPAPNLPTIQPFHAVGRPRYRRFGFSLKPETLASLRRRATGYGLTMNGVLLAAFAEILSVWSDDEALSLGVTLFNRPRLHPDVDRVIGEFTNTTLAAYDPTPDTFVARAQAVQDSLWHGIDHSAVSGVEILRMLGRDRPGRAVMPYIFTSLLETPLGAEDEPSQLAPCEVFATSQTPQVAIDHQIYIRDGTVRFIWDVAENVFPAGMIDSMNRAYQRLVRALAEGDEAWTANAPPEMEEGWLEVRCRLNDTAATLPEHRLHEPFFRLATEIPEHPAIVTTGRNISYGELAGWAAALATELNKASVGHGDRVAILMPKEPAQVAAVLAIHLVSAAYVPMAADNPPARNQTIVEDCDASAILTVTALAGLANELAGGRPVLLADAPRPPARPCLEPGTIDDMAYIIFTSGSTGRPKGVAITHGAAANTVADVNARHQVSDRDRVYALSSLSFDLSVYDIFGPLSVGGAIVLPEEAMRKSASTWARDVETHGVTLWNSVPALAELLVEEAVARNVSLASLRTVMLSGDWIPLTLPAALVQASPGVHIAGMGGATEAAIWSTSSPVDVPLDPRWRSIPYGAPMVNQSYHVLDSHLRPRPDWVAGDLYLAGAGLALGYWRDEEKTKAAFRTHPLTGERLYRTGDRARFWPDGRLEFLGRQDTQVKIGGHRIELGEIDNALATVLGPDAGRAHVVVTSGTPHLLAVLVSTSDQENLQERLPHLLPPYMIPHHYVSVERLPLTANGKIDRKVLDDLCLRSVTDAETPSPPGNGFEEILADIWRAILGHDDIGTNQDFFRLGGDSLRAIRLGGRIAQEFGLDFSIAQLFRTPTIAQQADWIIASLEAENGCTP